MNSILKISLAIFAFTFFSSVGYTQDIIFFKDGTKDSVKIVEIGIDLISYKKHKRVNSPIYKVKKERVVLIEFADGEIEIINTEPKKKTFETSDPVLQKRNILSLNLFGALLTNFHFGYENISKNGKMGIRTNLIASFAPYEYIGMYATGVDFNFYLNGQKRVNYFLGPSLRVGAFETDIPFASVLFNNGVSYSAKSGFFISTQLGVGPAVYQYEGLLAYGFWMLNLGARF